MGWLADPLTSCAAARPEGGAGCLSGHVRICAGVPGKPGAYRDEASRERERAEEFVAARRQHPAIESAINNLEHRGLNRVRTHGKEGFARSVALSVVATNVHRLGLILRQRETERRVRQRLAA